VGPRLARYPGCVAAARSRRSELSSSHPRVDLDWLIDTTAILGAAETYLLITRLTSAYQDWLTTTWTHLARLADGSRSTS
jgi:hypothetical protein